MSQTDPWSIYNFRLASNQPSAYSVPERHPSPYGPNVPQPDKALDPYAEAPDHAVVQAERYSDSLQACHPLGILSLPLVGDHIKCGDCDAVFTGNYRRGNLARHVRLKHTQGYPVTYPCTAYGCHSVFRRKDARLKHLHKRHPELYHPPVRQRQGGSIGSPTSHLHNSSAFLGDNSEPCAKPRDSGELTDLECIPQDTDTLRIWDQCPVNLAGSLPELSNDYPSDVSHTHGQDSVFSSDHLPGATATDASTTSEPSDLQQFGYFQSEDFQNVTRCCPVQNCTARTSCYNSFACHFRREHVKILQVSITDQFCLSGCNLSSPPGKMEENAIIKHMWDSHMLITCLDSQMNDLDFGAELEALPTPWFSEGTPTIPLYTFEADSALEKSREVLQSVKVDATSGAGQTASHFFGQEQCVSGRPAAHLMTACMTGMEAKPSGDELGLISTAQRVPPAVSHLEERISVKDPEVLPPFGARLIERLSVELEPQVHLKLWTIFFKRWEGILEVLKSRRSESHRWFAPVLETIRQNVQLNSADVSNLACSEGQRAHTNNESQPGAPTKKRSNPSVVTSNEPKRARKAGSFATDNKDDIQVKQAEKKRGDTLVGFDCIIYKHHLMHGTLDQSQCAGFNAAGVSQLRHHHLKPSRAGGHFGLIRFLERCERCKEDVFDEEKWLRHGRGECIPKSQRQNGGVAQWARLYLAEFPDAVQIPNPYVAQDVWLTDAECEEHRQSVLAIFPPVELSSDSFLDRRSVAEAEALPEPLDIPTETLIDEGLGRSAAYDIVFANILDPLSLRRDDRPVLRHEMPAQSHKHIFGGTLKLLSALAKESTLSADPNYCEELADQLEQLLPIIASLRREAQTALNSSNTSAGPVPTILNERRDSVPPSSETTSNTSSSIIRPSTQECESWSSSDEISTQTGSQFTFDIMDSRKPDDKHQDLLSGEVPNVHFEICPSGNPSMLEIEDKGADQVVALAYDDPTFNHGGTSVPDFEEFLRNLDQDTEPAKRGYNAWG